MTAKPLTQAELHNQLAPELIRTIVRRPLDSSGDLTDVAVLTESVLIGVVDAMIALGAPADVLDLIHVNAKHRQAQLRLVRTAKGMPQ